MKNFRWLAATALAICAVPAIAASTGPFSAKRLSDIDHTEPSTELDRLVLNHAREAIDTPSQPLFRNSRWAMVFMGTA